MPSAETIICDPAVFIKNRTELGLDSVGLSIKGDGADWGDSEHELFLVRQALGEIPADRHAPNRQVQIPLIAEEQQSGAKLVAALAKLQKKAGLWQREGGFIRRVLDPKGGFTEDVGMLVHSAALSGVEGWLMAHRNRVPDIQLNLITDPYFYGVNFVESELFKAENAQHLQWEIANVKGSAPGLVRCSVKNENAFDWRGLIMAMESRDLTTATKATTAAIAYECENLTMKGGTANAAEAVEASNGNVAKNTALTGGYIEVLNSKIAASGLHMTHIGNRRLWLRARDPSVTNLTPNIELELQWRPLGNQNWNANEAKKVPRGTNRFSKIDLGTCQPELAVLGEQRWEWRLLARAINGAGTIEMDIIFVMPQESYLKLTTPERASSAAESSSLKSAGTVANDASLGGTAWVNPENAKASDNVYANCEPADNSYTQLLKATNFAFAIPAEATITGVEVEIEVKGTGISATMIDADVRLVAGGNIVGSQKAQNKALPAADTYFVYGGASTLWNTEPIGGVKLTPAVINAANFGVVFRGFHQVALKLGQVDHIRIRVYYTAAPDDNKVCFAGRSIESRTEGVFRQHLTDEVWGRGVPDGQLPYAPPSGLEARPLRGIIVPSQSAHDLVNAPGDTGKQKLSARVTYFPGYHFVSEV